MLSPNGRSCYSNRQCRWGRHVPACSLTLCKAGCPKYPQIILIVFIIFQLNFSVLVRITKILLIEMKLSLLWGETIEIKWNLIEVNDKDILSPLNQDSLYTCTTCCSQWLEEMWWIFNFPWIQVHDIITFFVYITGICFLNFRFELSLSSSASLFLINFIQDLSGIAIYFTIEWNSFINTLILILFYLKYPIHISCFEGFFDGIQCGSPSLLQYCFNITFVLYSLSLNWLFIILCYKTISTELFEEDVKRAWSSKN